MFSGFFFTAVGIAATPPATLPGGTGLVTVAGGVGQKLDYGAAYTFARMNAAGTVMQFVDPVLSTGGLRSVSGQLAARLDPDGAIDADVVGMRVRTAIAKGTRIDGNDLVVALSPTGGLKFEVDGLGYKYDAAWYGFATLGSNANGLRVALNTSTMMVDGIGIGVDPAKVAVLSGGKTTAANARGKTLLFDDMFSASGNVSITTGTQTSIATLSLGTLSVGDTIDAFGMATRDGAQGDTMQFQITSSPTLGLGTVYSTHTAYVAGAGVGGSGGIPVVYRASVAGPHYAHLSMAKAGAANFACFQRRITGKVYAP